MKIYANNSMEKMEIKIETVKAGLVMSIRFPATVRNLILFITIINLEYQFTYISSNDFDT